jgi:hypothetical protein
MAMAMAWATGCAPVGVPWLTPTPEAAPHLRAAIDAWTVAGVDATAVYVGPGGAPVTVTDGPPRPGKAGTTSISWDGRIEWVRVDRAAPPRVWVHEVGHVLAGTSDHGGCVMAPTPACDAPTAEDMALAGW